jgi:hypothetical protein
MAPRLLHQASTRRCLQAVLGWLALVSQSRQIAAMNAPLSLMSPESPPHGSARGLILAPGRVPQAEERLARARFRLVIRFGVGG